MKSQYIVPIGVKMRIAVRRALQWRWLAIEITGAALLEAELNVVEEPVNALLGLVDDRQPIVPASRCGYIKIRALFTYEVPLCVALKSMTN
jgi:hypothetical protein